MPGAASSVIPVFVPQREQKCWSSQRPDSSETCLYVRKLSPRSVTRSVLNTASTPNADPGAPLAPRAMTNRDPFWIAMRDVAQRSAHTAAFIVFRHETSPHQPARLIISWQSNAAAAGTHSDMARTLASNPGRSHPGNSAHHMHGAGSAPRHERAVHGAETGPMEAALPFPAGTAGAAAILGQHGTIESAKARSGRNRPNGQTRMTIMDTNLLPAIGNAEPRELRADGNRVMFPAAP